MATELEGLVERLSARDPTAVRGALEDLSHSLARDMPTRDQLERLERALTRLAAHEVWSVRQAVARSLEHFRHESFERIAGTLAGDPHAFVRAAARRAIVRRTDSERSSPLREQHDALVRRWLDDLETKHGRAAREAAKAAATKLAGLIVREADHELTKVLHSLSQAIGCVIDAHEAATVDKEACRRPLEHATNAVAMIQRILESVRGLMTEVTPRFRPERLDEVIAEAAQLAGPTDAFAAEVPKELIVEVDRHRLVFALSNLIKNAHESHAATGRPPRVVLRARLEDGGNVVLVIRDEGCGMGPEELRSAFRLFGSSKPGGTGFGLPLAQKVIEQEHRGRISLASQLGAGTEVTVTLPLVQSQESES